jgi:hypothetical protein
VSELSQDEVSPLKRNKAMKKQYMIPTSNVVCLSSLAILSGSGPGAGDQHDPGKNSRRTIWDDEEDEEEEYNDNYHNQNNLGIL